MLDYCNTTGTPGEHSTDFQLTQKTLGKGLNEKKKRYFPSFPTFKTIKTTSSGTKIIILIFESFCGHNI